ncbi:MAG: SLC13 family permease [Anaerolineae bacterium]|jgi:di/tricarboxylate transporter|nr:SLC13 family permease [Anaerolineae bacterium]
MTIQIGLLILIIIAAVVLFSIDQFRADIIALGLLVTLSLTGLIPPGETFAGFGSDTAVMIFGLLVMTAAVTRTGVIDLAGRNLLYALDRHLHHLPLATMAIVTLLSGFVSNTATAALFLPIVLELSRRTGTPRSRLLMPLAFAAILGSSISLVASSTNVLISGLMVEYGLDPLRMFELALVGLPIAVTGLLYMQFIGNRLIPVRDGGPSESTFAIRPYLAEAVVAPGSPLTGRTLAESSLGRDLDLTVVRIVRDNNRYLVPRPQLQLQEGDELLVKGDRSDVLRIKDLTGLDLKAEVKLSDPRLQTEDLQLAEVVILPGSPVSGRTLKTLQFRQRYGLQVLGLHRREKDLFSKLSQVRLRPGDELLVQGPHTSIAALDSDHFYTLGMIERTRANQRRAPISVAIFLGALLLATLEIVSLPIAVTLGTLGVFVTRCITPDEAYHQVQWQALIVVGCMLALGVAMEHTGTARFLAEQVIRLQGLNQPIVLLSVFFFLTMLLTQPMSNQAAAVLVLPIAVQTASHLGLNPRTFAVMVAVSASCSFITPLEPACLIVYGPGHYKFLDFTRVGALLTIIIYVVSILLVPLFWPLIP